MSYETTTEVVLGVFHKLSKEKNRTYNKIAELTLQIRILDLHGGESELIEELENEKIKNEKKLQKAELQLKLLQKRRNGGASLDPFLSDEVLQKTEDKMNELYPDNDIKIQRWKHPSKQTEE